MSTKNTDKKEQLELYLNDFSELEKKHSGHIPHVISLDFKKHSGHVVFGALVHGNEVGPLPAILRFIKKLISGEIKYQGKISFFIGNILAAQKDLRFIENDLNRSFGSRFQGSENSLERKRALELMPLLTQADVFFDFHQTIMPSLKPFYIFEMDYQSYYWARAAGVASTFVTRKKGAAFSTAGQCSDEFARSLKKPGITIELGEKGFHKETEWMAFEIMKRSVYCMDKVYGKNPISIKELAQKNNDFQFFSIAYKEPFSHPQKRLNAGFCNFNKVTKEMVLGADEQQNPLKAPVSGFLLFPKYPKRGIEGEAQAPLPGEIFVIATELKKHPLLWKS